MRDSERCAQAAAVARRDFGFVGEAAALPGEFDQNFRVSGRGEGLQPGEAPERGEAPGGGQAPERGADIVLKLGPESRRPVFDLVAACLLRLENAPLSAAVPRIVPPLRADGPDAAPPRPGLRSGAVASVDFGGEPRAAIAATFVPGIPLAELRPRSMPVLRALGALLAEIDLALDGFDHPELERPFAWRMESAPETIEAHLGDLRAGRGLVAATMDRALRRLGPVRDSLPVCAIHNDANDHNVMVEPSLRGARLSGLIDFGDITRGWRAAEVAVAATYSMMGLPDPFEAACAIARGYSSAATLNADECRAVVPLVALRLCMSVAIQAREMARQPDNAYLAVSQKGAWDLLDALAQADWRIAEFRIREACGLPPNPKAVAPPPARSPIMPPELLARPHVLDLSVESLDLPHPDSLAEPDHEPLANWAAAQVAAAGATIGVGRYGEARLLYDAPSFRSIGNSGPEARTIHLGIDLCAPAGTPVFSPLPGTVVSVADNSEPRDYGPTVILRHATPEGAAFHTLFGHLDRAALELLAPGQRVAPGDLVGHLGDAGVNGGWPPHLHFQVIALDPLHDPGAGAPAQKDAANFPGVALERLRAVWESILPDPTPLVGLPPSTPAAVPPRERPAQRKRRLAERRGHRLGPSLSLSYADPIHMVRGRGAWLYDHAGRAYLDAVNNVPHVGHANLRVARAIARHSRVLNTNTRYLHGEIVALADELLAHFPAPLEVVFLVCSGSEANELALRMARCRTGKEGVVCLEGGYHGNTGGLVEISHYKFAGPGGAGPSPRVEAAPMPDVYRGRFRRAPNATSPKPANADPADPGPTDAHPADPADLYAAEVARAAARLARKPAGVAAFIAEPMLGCGGQIEPPPGYLRRAFEHVRARGGVCIADEVQVGFGRVGDAFWAFELQDSVPDIVTLGKPMGNGHPIAAVVTTREIADAFANGMEYFSTFGGNPVSCAAARAVLAEIRDRKLQQSARRVGRKLLAGLRKLAERHPVIGDARGRGLFLGIELVRDRKTRAPFPEACAYLVNRARELGVLLSADGPEHNVVKIKPPLVFGLEEAETLLRTIDQILGETAVRRACM